MRLAARLVIVGMALAVGGTAAGCSAAPGLAYAQGATRPSVPLRAPPLRCQRPRARRPRPRGLMIDARRAPGSQGEGGHPGRRRHRPGAVGQGRGHGAADRLHHQGDDRAGHHPGGRAGPKVTVPKAVTAYVAKYDANAAGLIPGQVFTVDQLLHVMLVVSAADAAYTLANAYGPGLPAFMAKMNAEATRLGLMNTHFTSPDGLPYPTETSTYSTPAELVRLGEVAMSYPEFRSIVGLRVYNLPKGDGHSAVSVSTQLLPRPLSGRHGHQDRLHQRRGAHPPLRGGPQRPRPHRRRPGLPAQRLRRRRAGRRQDPQLGLRPQASRRAQVRPSAPASPRCQQQPPRQAWARCRAIAAPRHLTTSAPPAPRPAARSRQRTSPPAARPAPPPACTSVSGCPPNAP